MRTLVWFRGKDLRVADHAPLAEAARDGELVPLFVVDPHFFAPERAGRIPHRMQVLCDALAALDRRIAGLGSRLIVVPGRSVEVVPMLAAYWRVDRVVAHRWSEPIGRQRDQQVAGALAVPLVLHEGETLFPPGRLHKPEGGGYQVFGAFARAFRRRAAVAPPLPAPDRLPPLPGDVAATLDRLAIPPPTAADLDLAGNPRLPRGGEDAGLARLRAFVGGAAARYDVDRDRLDVDGTSRLSIDLKFGTVSARAAWHAAATARDPDDPALLRFHDQLLWREFAHHLLWDRPELLEQPFQASWQGFPWRDDPAGWRAWCDGTTGYPVVDAAARQLLAEGFVPNRARMIAASFLTKHLLGDFRRGEAHYLRWLADGDWAVNDLGWQWVAGCGCDASPYHRVFNPVLQGARYDPDGAWVRRWVPELAGLRGAAVHAPWLAAPGQLRAAGVTLGRTYPAPVVDHGAARQRFLAVAREHLRGRRPVSAGAGSGRRRAGGAA